MGGGDRGDSFVVRSRKRKATQPDDQGRDRSRIPERCGGCDTERGNTQQWNEADNRGYRRHSRVYEEHQTTGYYSDQYQHDRRRVRVLDRRDSTKHNGSNTGYYWDQQRFDGCRFNVEDRHGTVMHKGADFIDDEHNNGSKVTFYFANILDFISLFCLRQFFEVCGILSDVYVARQLNYRGKLYGFVRFENVRNRKEKKNWHML